MSLLTIEKENNNQSILHESEKCAFVHCFLFGVVVEDKRREEFNSFGFKRRSISLRTG